MRREPRRGPDQIRRCVADTRCERAARSDAVRNGPVRAGVWGHGRAPLSKHTGRLGRSAVGIGGFRRGRSRARRAKPQETESHPKSQRHSQHHRRPQPHASDGMAGRAKGQAAQTLDFATTLVEPRPPARRAQRDRRQTCAGADLGRWAVESGTPFWRASSSRRGRQVRSELR